MPKIITVYMGKVEENIFGDWADCSPGIYIDHDKIESIFAKFIGKNIKVTIELLEG